MMLMTDWHEVY